MLRNITELASKFEFEEIGCMCLLSPSWQGQTPKGSEIDMKFLRSFIDVFPACINAKETTKSLLFKGLGFI